MLGAVLESAPLSDVTVSCPSDEPAAADSCRKCCGKDSATPGALLDDVLGGKGPASNSCAAFSGASELLGELSESCVDFSFFDPARLFSCCEGDAGLVGRGEKLAAWKGDSSFSE